MKKPTIAVLGSKGMLGSDLIHVLINKNQNVLGYHRPNFDFTCTTDIERVVKSAAVIVNCVAYTNVDAAENDKIQARAVNATAVKELGRLAAKLDRYVIHISTDFVYDGTKKGAYTENDSPNPINYYGQSKLDGERFLTESGCRHAIVRLQWTYGNSGNNFVKKIYQQANQTNRISVVDDQIGSPTLTTDIAKALHELLKNEREGLFLFAAKEYASRFEIAEFIVKQLGLSVKVTPCQTSEFVCPAQRPLNSKFYCGKIDSTLSINRTEWNVSLANYLEKIK